MHAHTVKSMHVQNERLLSWVGNLIFRANGSNDKMLCCFSVSEDVSSKSTPKQESLSVFAILCSYVFEIQKKGECHAMLSSFNVFTALWKVVTGV